MKTFPVKRGVLNVFTALALSVFVLACNKDDNNDGTQNYTTSGNANGAQQNPPVTTSGTATHTGTYNTETNIWQYSVNWTSLSSAATIVELRGPAAVGVNGSLLFTLTITAGGING